MKNKFDRIEAELRKNRAELQFKENLFGGSTLTDSEKAKTRPAFPGEMHPWSIASGARYNYLGPKTQVIKRAFERKDPPINDLDSAAKSHDVGYVKNASLFKAGQITRSEFLGNVKKLDAEFKEKAKESKDAPYLGKISAVAIGAKEVAEDLFLPMSAFSGGAVTKMKKDQEKKKAKDPAERLRKIVKESKPNGSNHIEVNIKDILKKENLNPEIEGGFIPLAVAGAAILSGLASTALDRLITHFTGSGMLKGSGSVKRLNKADKIQFLLNNVPEKDLIKGVEDVLAINK